MAQLDPDYKDVAVPEARGWTRPISDIQGDKSKGTLLSGIGNAFKEGITGAVDLVKSDVSDQIQTGVTQLRDAANTGLRWTKNALEGGVTQQEDQGTLYQRADLQGQKIPNGVKAMINNAGTLTSARENGHISETYYWGKLDQLTSSIRSQYPGFRDYIDSEMEKVSGKNPANALMASLIGDINAKVAAAKEEKDKLPNAIFELVKEGDPGAYKVYDGLRKGVVSTTQAAEYLANTKAGEWNLRQQKTKVESSNLSAGEVSKATEDMITGRAAEVTANAIRGHMVGDGFGDDGDAVKAVTALQNGKATPQDKERVLSELNQTEVNVEAALRAEFTKAEQGSKSHVQNLGPNGYQKMNDIIKQSTEMIRTLREDIINDKYGSLHADARMNTAYGTQAGRALMEDPNIGTAMKTSKGFEQVAGPNWYQAFLTTSLIPKLSPDVVAAVQQRMEKMLNPTPDNVINPKTFKSVTEDLKARGIKAPEAYSKILDQVDVISDKTADPRVRMQAVRAFFDQGNQGILKLFNKDTWVDGKFLPGQESMFGKMTSPDTTKAVFELSKADPTLWGKYANWAKTEYGTIFRDKVVTLSQFDNTNIQMRWDPFDKINPIKADPTIKMQGTNPQIHFVRGLLDRLQPVLNRVNSGLSNLGHIAEAEGSDPRAYMIEQLVENGIDPTKMEGIPADIMKSIIRQKAEKPEKEKARAKSYGGQ